MIWDLWRKINQTVRIIFKQFNLDNKDDGVIYSQNSLNKIIFELNNLLDGMNKNEDEINVKSICNKSNNEIDTSDYHLKTELFYDLGETLQLAKNVSSGSFCSFSWIISKAR